MANGDFETVDVAVVGGGIVGCSAALSLAQKGARVALFERGRLGAEQSSRAWGFVRQQGRHEAEIPLAAEANGLWVELTARFGHEGTHFTRAGILVPAETSDDEERVQTGYADARAFGLDTRILNRAEIRELLPQLEGDWRSGLYTAGDAHADPGRSTATIAAAARAAGVSIHENTPVIGVEETAGRISGVVTATGRCPAGAVVLAGGIGSPLLARQLGIDLPIQVIRSSVGHTAAAAPFTKVAMWGPTVAYRPQPDGSFTIGNGYRGVGADYDITINSLRNLRYFLPAFRRNSRLLKLSLGTEFVSQMRTAFGGAAAHEPLPEPDVNAAKVVANLSAFRHLFPHLGGLPLQRSWAGRIDLTPDVVPIIDRPDPRRNVYVAAGFSGHGFALGPSVGKQLSEWILGGRPSLDMSAFRLSRFAEGSATVKKQAL
ncbi:MAG: hypothetical protein JWR08_355 [Enterovirga sp.]|nr:hypothetical protein [Enterovirga sp.]